ncbi:Nucleotidyltransferase [Saccharata proteae CBS 121410]|uniref:DNA polymerase n=1 Tax=Saccharata proteae CBS 121410 TaxID=1314787 RepID=A0A6A5YBX0_9PEZI|nr:Nucleotidyltransferase [Saccharata proteae CBS 121410]
MSDPPISSKQPKRSLITAASFPRALGKRKREAKIHYKPEDQQVFKDLVFFFFPNNDTHTGRRIRITKALEYGATWVKEWCSEVTHVIVDKSFHYDQITAWLKIASFPGKAVVVNETYPADCLMHRFLIDPKQSHYQVPGYAERTGNQVSNSFAASTAPSSQSLKPKPAKKDAITRITRTPSRTDDSSHEALQGTEPGTPVGEHQPPRLETVSDLKYDDALDAVITETKEFQHLPLDFEEDTTSHNDNSSDDTESDHVTSKKPIKKAKLGGNFQCMEENDGKGLDTNPNERTIEILSQMCKYYEDTKDEWRSRAYRRAIASLRKQTRKIVTMDEAAQLPFVGERLAAKIEEIAWTNRLRRLENALGEPSDEALRRFLQIYGVGLSQATRWVQQGYKTLDDLRHHVKLTSNQLVGINHYDDFLARIPRMEVAQHGSVVREALQKIDPAIEVTIGGSYRRGAPDSGDIDLIITAPSADAHYLRTTVLDILVPQLMGDGYLTASLAATRRDEGSKWHGACVLPGSSIWRRIDLLLVPWDEMGAALVYFTGNDIFNRSIRLLASKKGMRLNQRGLYKDSMRGRNREKVTVGTLLEGRSERRIFEILGVPWRPPEHRIC